MIINMNVGGTERALLNMIEEMPEEKFDITILMLEKHGKFLNSIPKRVHQKFLNEYSNMKDILNRPPKEVITNHHKKGLFIKGSILILIYLLSKLTRNKTLLFKYLLKNMPNIKIEYDIAIAYAGTMDFISYFVIHKINANKKIQWIHFDINEIGFNEYFATKVYKRFDRIFTVSEEAREKLVKMVPSINDKTKVFTNMISPELIIEEAKMGVGFQQDNFTGIRIVTVGRLAFEKGQDLAIKAMVKLIKDGINVKWYCIGEGKGRKEYEELIDRYQLQDKFILLGENSNPYRFIKECDIYVQPSRHEGYCITLAEARALDRPIVTTSFTGAKEQVKHNETGLVVSIHEDQIYYAVKGLIYNPKQREKFSRNLSNEMFESIGRIGRIYNIV